MTILTDNKHTVSITMAIWDSANRNYSPDFSGDFFNVGSLPYDDEADAYRVEDVYYCLDQAQNWAECIGDYCDDGEPAADMRYVDYTVIR